MRLLHSRDSWSYHMRSEPTLSFCLWVLQIDGLHVPPFDQHPDGDGSLRALGLTAENWQVWFLRAIDPAQSNQDIEQIRQQSLAAYIKDTGITDLEQLGKRYRAERFKVSAEPPLPPFPEFHHYHASWTGNNAVRDKLIELQKEYQQVSGQFERIYADLYRAQAKEEHRSEIRLYNELKVYASRVPSLTIYFVMYEYPLDYIVPPGTLLMTVQEGQPDPQEFRERALAGVAELAARPGRGGKQSLYTRIASQPAAAYCRHVRKPIPPPLPRQEVPRLADPARQAVLEELSDRLFYGAIDLASLQFLREKQRPGWKLYEVTFQEVDGEQHREFFILQQNEDGSWLRSGGGSSSDIQNRWSELVAPVHDHPLLFFTPNWINPGDYHYLLTAHGQVIDNGSHVERMRLVNDAGQVLEDTVEDGYVFFACTPEQRVQLPMQAELYDHQNKLVWRQTVPDTPLSFDKR